MRSVATPTSPPEVTAPALGRVTVPRFLLIAAQLILVILIVRQFQIESAAFLRVAILAFAGFAVHAFLPLAWRLPFFALLSLAAIGMVLGVPDAAWLVAIGLGLIAPMPRAAHGGPPARCPHGECEPHLVPRQERP